MTILINAVIGKTTVTNETLIRAYFMDNYEFSDIVFLDQSAAYDMAAAWSDSHTEGDLETLQTLNDWALVQYIEEEYPLTFWNELKEAYYEKHYSRIVQEFNNDLIIKNWAA
jgi:hypothetical protein